MTSSQPENSKEQAGELLDSTGAAYLDCLWYEGEDA